jgi:hypothetical protein
MFDKTQPFSYLKDPTAAAVICDDPLVLDYAVFLDLVQ